MTNVYEIDSIILILKITKRGKDMISRQELKAQAKAQMEGKFGMIFICLILYYVISSAVSMLILLDYVIPFLGTIAIYFVLAPVMMGYIRLYLEITYGGEPNPEFLIGEFKGRWLSSASLYLLTLLYTFLWSLLFIIPGIVKAYSYSMAPYILAENPHMTANEAITESRRIMDGRKWEFFVLNLSFFPWMMLGVITCGLAYIYITPYMQLTFTNYYHNIKGAPQKVDYEIPVQDIV